MAHDIVDLSTCPQHIPLVAQWIYNEFWADKQEHTTASLEERLQCAARCEGIPVSLLALVSGQPVGTVNLIECDDDRRTHLRPWLAALYVAPAYRYRGVGSSLVRAIQQKALSLGEAELYLGTDQPSFYEGLGATLHQQVTPQFCIMRISSRSG